VRLQDAAAPEDKLFFSVAGWHALTLPQDPKALLEARTTMIALILASGVDPRRSIVFHQDEVDGRLDGLASRDELTPATGSKSHRVSMDFKLHDAAWEAEADDDLESTCYFSERDGDNLNFTVDAAGCFKKRQ
jgi:tryptophanyl-tRNA synthetase